MSDILIVIIGKNSYQSLNKLINSIRYQNGNTDFEVKIISNKKVKSYRNYYITHLEGDAYVHFEEFEDGNYLEVLNRNVQETKSNQVLVLEDKYILGKNFFNTLLQASNGDKSLLHPEFSVLYNGKTGLKRFTKGMSPNGLFEKRLYENVIFAHKDCFEKINFSNPFGSEFWQFYCDAIAAGFSIRIVDKAVVFENVSEEKLFLSQAEGPLIKSELFEGTNLSNISFQGFPKEKESNKLLINNLFNGNKSIKQLVRNYINDTNTKYVNLSSNKDYGQLLKEWRDANIIEPLLFPEEYLIKSVELIAESYENLAAKYVKLEQQYKSDTRYLFLIPSIRIGGGTKVINNYIKALLSKYNPEEISVITTDDKTNDKSMLPAGINIINLKQIIASDQGAIILLLRLIMQKKPYAVHNINSEIGYKLFAKFAKYLSSSSKLYLTFFALSKSIEGKTVGHMLEFLPSFYEYLTAVSTDNKAVVDMMDKIYGMGKDKYAVHYQPIDTSEAVSRNKTILQEKPVNSKIVILWASRIDYQKNIPLLYEIAKYYNEKSKYGKQVEFLVAGIVEEDSKNIFNKLTNLPNVKYWGAFSNIHELPIEKCDLYLYTSISDGMPNILLEIMAMNSIGIVASNIPTIKELLDPDKGKLATKFEDYITHIDAYIENNNSLNEEIINAYKYVKAEFSWEQFENNIKNFKDYM